MQNKKTNRLFSLALVGVIFRLAGPTMLEQLLQTLVQYIDTAMVGSLGTDATATVGATTTVNWLVGSTVSAFGVGFLTFIARALGSDDKARAREVAAQSIFVVLLTGIFFTALTLGISSYVPVWMQVEKSLQKDAALYFFILYTPMLFRAATTIFGTVLRAAGDTKTPMAAGIIVNVSNVLLNILFIFPTRAYTLLSHRIVIPGIGMGVIGAAIASAISYTLGGICITVALWRQPLISPKGQSLRPRADILLPALRVAMPNMLQRFVTSFGYVAFASMINSLGKVSIAAHTIANTVESAFYIPGYGMMTASATLAGNALGARDSKRMKELSRTALVVETALMVVSGGLLFAFAPNMMRIFSKDDRVIRLGAFVLRMVALSEPFYGMSIIMEGMMQGVGETIKPLLCSISTMWVIRILGTFLCTRIWGLGLIAAWSCMITHNLVLFLLMLIIFLSGRWNPLQKTTE